MKNLRVLTYVCFHTRVCPKLIWMNITRIRLKLKWSCLNEEDKASFTTNSVVNLYIVHELDRWSWYLNTDFTLKDCLFGAGNLTKNADRDKFKYTGYDTEFDSRSQASFTDETMAKMSLFL